MIISVGEVVWDIFPDREVLGGAPINVAYHLRSLRLEVGILTRIGRDDLGSQTLARLAALGLPVDGVQLDEVLPTGRVNISFDARKEPRFDIVAPAVWDNLDLPAALRQVDGKEFSLVYGTLAQRNSSSRKVIRELWSRATFCFYDVNLRPPHTTEELVKESLAAADLVKLNEQEFRIIASWEKIIGKDKKNIAHELCRRYDLVALVVTGGSEGAWLVSDGDYFENPAMPTQVADTVGAGDAFFAALIEGYLQKRPWPEILAGANKRGAYVASRHGATPPMMD
jgi:fructokinase